MSKGEAPKVEYLGKYDGSEVWITLDHRTVWIERETQNPQHAPWLDLAYPLDLSGSLRNWVARRIEMFDADHTTVEADGLTACCHALTSFHDEMECCKVCWREVMNPAEGVVVHLDAPADIVDHPGTVMLDLDAVCACGHKMITHVPSANPVQPCSLCGCRDWRAP